jgi:hypothetical protein
VAELYRDTLNETWKEAQKKFLVNDPLHNNLRVRVRTEGSDVMVTVILAFYSGCSVFESVL